MFHRRLLAITGLTIELHLHHSIATYLLYRTTVSDKSRTQGKLSPEKSLRLVHVPLLLRKGFPGISTDHDEHDDHDLCKGHIFHIQINAALRALPK